MPKKKQQSSLKRNYNLYVIGLNKRVLDEPRFLRRNPHYGGKKECVYVGMTANPVEYRYAQHKSGMKANRYANRYGVCVLPELCQVLEGVTRTVAEKRETKLAAILRNRGYAVWQA